MHTKFQLKGIISSGDMKENIFQIKGFEGRLMLAFALLLRIRLILHFISVYIEMKITPFLMIPKRSLNKFQKHAIE